MSLVFDQKERVGAWVAQKADPDVVWGSFYAMGVERQGEIVAGVVLNQNNGANALCHVAVEKPGKEMLLLFTHFCRYAFLQIGLKRLTGLVPRSNAKVLHFDLKLGFEIDHVIKDGALDGDMVMLVMWPHKCPWLTEDERNGLVRAKQN